MSILKSTYAKGIALGILVGIAWGLDGVLMGEVSVDVSTVMFMGTDVKSLVTALFHDGFAFMWIALFLIYKKQFKGAIKLLKTKKGWATIVAALVGAPIGMSAYLLGIQFAGAPYASSISVIYPGVGAVLSYFILKEKLSLHACVGVVISLLGSFMLGFNPSANVPPTFMKGVMFSLVAVLGWALEGVIVGFAMKKIKDEEDVEATPQQLLGIRYFTALVSYLIIVPSIGGFDTAVQICQDGLVFSYMGIAILGAITYLAWYTAVDYIGAAMGTALNSTACLWSIIFSSLLFHKPITLNLAIWGIVIVIGVFVFAIDPKTLFKRKRSS